MLRYECGQNPYEMRKKAIMQFIDTHTVAYVGLERKGEIESMVTEIISTGIKFKDACMLHQQFLPNAVTLFLLTNGY